MARLNKLDSNLARKFKTLRNKSKVVKKRKGGGTLIQCPAVFSEDSEYIYVNSGWGVRVFSVKTGECVKVFETVSSGYGRVLSIMTISGYTVVTTIDYSDKIYLLHWDPKSYVKRKVELKLPATYESCVGVHTCLVPSLSDSSSHDLCLVVRTSESGYSVLFYDAISADYLCKHPLNGTGVGHCAGRQTLAFGGPPELRIMATIVKDIGLCVYSLDGTKKLLKWQAGSKGVDWVSVNCHPMEPCVAAGDSLGRCVLFRNPLLNPKIKTIFHWHTLPCIVVTFTPAGSTMYTGGGEHVLVKWNVENPNVKYFMPRLSAPIVHISISPDNSFIAVSTLDNGIIIVDSSHKVKCVLQQLAWGNLSHSDAVLFPSGLTFDPVSRSLVLNSRPGHLQFYCPETENMTSVDVCRQNYLTQERTKVIVNTDVTRVALTTDSAWMATVEMRQELNVSLELRLKVWQYQISDKRWNLNSVVDMPHSGLIGCLKFRPVSSLQDSITDYLLVTTGKDAMYRLWSPTPIDSVYKKGVMWKCVGAASYKDRAAGPACFSQDGSILAVAFEHIVTLWSTEGLKFKTSLSRKLPHIKQVEFGGESCSHMLVTTTEHEVTVWNLLTLCIQWTANVNSSLLVSELSSPFMALFSNNNNVYIFNPLFPDCVHVEKTICNPGVKILGATFALRETVNSKSPPWLQRSILYYIDSDQELNCFESELETESGFTDLIHDEEKTTLFGDLKKIQSKSSVKIDEDVHPRRHQYGEVGATAVSEFLRAPCHTMPPVSTLCTSLLAAFSLSKKSVKEKEQEEGMELEDDEENSDEGIGDETDSDQETSKKTNIEMGADVSKINTDMLKSLDSKPESDKLFFIDLDDEVDNIINS